MHATFAKIFSSNNPTLSSSCYFIYVRRGFGREEELIGDLSYLHQSDPYCPVEFLQAGDNLVLWMLSIFPM